MRAVIISLGSESSKWISEAMKNYFYEVDDINIKNVEINIEVHKSVVLQKGKVLIKKL